jgi:hypothetical protein
VVSGQNYDSTPAPGAPAGTFSFIATYCNGGGSTLTGGLEARTRTLTNSNVLLNRDEDPAGVGSVLYFPATGDYSNRTLACRNPLFQPTMLRLEFGFSPTGATAGKRDPLIFLSWTAGRLRLGVGAALPVHRGRSLF